MTSLCVKGLRGNLLRVLGMAVVANPTQTNIDHRKKITRIISTRLAVECSYPLEADMRVSAAGVKVPQGNHNANVEHSVSQKEMEFCRSTSAVKIL